jgi:hypothetical protein
VGSEALKRPEVTTYDYNAIQDDSSMPDLASFGYSSTNSHTSLGILQKLESLELGGAQRPRRKREISLCLPVLEMYQSILKQLPCSSCVAHLVDLFFDEVNWQYTILDRNYFIPKLDQYYATQPPSPSSQSRFSSEQVIFSALLFQLLAYALQFLPASYAGKLHTSCLEGIADDDASVSEDATMRLLGLLPRDVINLDYIAAQILRTAWLKTRGLVAEAWLVLVQATINAQEIGIHRDDGKLYANDAESAIEELWEVVLRRRLMLNLYLWDRYAKP